MQLAIIGGGPAGLYAAEVAALGGATVTLYDAKPSVGRKFLVAGRGGLNLTHAEDAATFAARYQGPEQPAGVWEGMLQDFGPEALREWAAGLGVETFAASTGRVYPRALKAAPLLRRWVHRLRDLGVEIAVRHRWVGLKPGPPITLQFEHGGESRSPEADAVILALGGGSWPETGSDGGWVAVLKALDVAVSPLEPANCGWECAWPAELLAAAEGEPLKNVAVRAGSMEARGELLITRYGLEGGALYRLGAELRRMAEPLLRIDLKPEVSAEQLLRKMHGVKRELAAEARRRWRLSDAAEAVLRMCAPYGALDQLPALAAAAKECLLRLQKPRPLAEAISSAGGVRWRELDDELMIRRLPGVFVAGEMIDWEAPTGGYLIQGCFATGARAARGALRQIGR